MIRDNRALAKKIIEKVKSDFLGSNAATFFV
jgi:hypothetical protein